MNMKPKTKMTLLYSILAAASLASAVTFLALAVESNYSDRPQPFSLLQSDDGRWRYVKYDWDISSEEYVSREAAEKEATREKAWHEQYQRDLEAGKYKAKRAAEEARKSQFKPAP